MERRSLILDSGALIALSRGDRTVRKIVEAAQEAGGEVIVPPSAVTQVTRGQARDAGIHRLLSVVWIPFVGKRLALAAGALLGTSGLSDAVDAQVMAEAIRSGPSVVLTSDPDDMASLAGTRTDVHIIRI